MNIRQKINLFRRRIRQGLVKSIGKSHFDRNADLSKVEIKRVLICRPNHRLGNLLLITPLLQEVIATFPDCEIDLFVKGNIAPIIFKNYKNINTIIQLPRKPLKDIKKYIGGFMFIKKRKYDIVINAVKNSSSGRLATQFANSKHKVFGWEDKEIESEFEDYEHIAKYQIYSFRSFLNRRGFKKNNEEIPSLSLNLSSSEIYNGEKKLRNLIKNEKKTICIYTHATADKCYSKSWWAKFYKKLKVEYPNHNIIEVLPVENISMIFFKAPAFYSKDVREIASFVANTEIFIGADCGIMHLASAAHTPTVGFFSRPNLHHYNPYNNGSIAIDTSNNTDIKEYINILNEILLPLKDQKH